MLETYQGVLRDNRIEWMGEAPKSAGNGHGVRVHVTLLERVEVTSGEQGRRMAEALERLSALGGVTSISEPVEWERELRQDRPLPGREE